MKVKTPEYVEISSDSDLYIKRDIDGTSLVVGVHDFEIPDPLTLHNGLISEDNPSRFSAGLYATKITLGDGYVEKGFITSDSTATKLCHKDGYSIEVKSNGVNIKDTALTALLSVGSDSDLAYLDVNCPIRPNSYFTTIKTPDISGKEDSGKIEFTGGHYGQIEFFLYNSNDDSYVSVGSFSHNGFVTDTIQSRSVGILNNRVSDIYVNTIHALNYDGLPSGQVSTVDRLIVNGSTKLQAESNKVQVYTNLVPNQHLSLGTLSDSWSDGYIDNIYVEKIKFKARTAYINLYVNPESDYDFILEGNFLPDSSSGSTYGPFSLGNSTSYWSNGYIHELFSNKLTLSEASSVVELYSDRGCLTSSCSIVPDVTQGTLLDLGAGDRSWGTLYVKALSNDARLAIVNMLLDNNGIGCLKMIMIPSNVVKNRGDEIDAPYVWDFFMGWMSDDSGYNIKRDSRGWNQYSLNGTWKALNSYGGGALNYYVVLAVRVA